MQQPRRNILRFTMAATLAASLLAGAVSTAHAEASEVRISHGYGILYLPIMVMASEHLLEKQAKAAGLGDVKVSYRILDGGNVINDAMLSGALDIASLGVPGFLTLWDKTRGSAIEVRGLSSLSSSSMYLMTRNPNVKTLADFSDKDRIAVPGIKTSLPAVVLQMAAAKTFGDKQFNKLDPITVPLPHLTPPPSCWPAAARSTATWPRHRSRTPRLLHPACTACSTRSTCSATSRWT